MRRVVIADDSLLLRQGVSAVLATLDDVEVVAEAEDRPGLMAEVDRHRPDLVITDVRMPPTFTNEGIAAAREIRSLHPDTGVIVLSQYLDADYIIELLQDGTEVQFLWPALDAQQLAELRAALEGVLPGCWRPIASLRDSI